MVNYHLVHNRRRIKERPAPIEVCLRFPDGHKVYRSTQIKIHPIYWDDTNKKIRKTHPEYGKLDYRLKQFLHRLDAAILNNEHFSPSDISRVIDLKRGPIRTFNEFYRDELSKTYNVTPSTYGDQKQTLDVLNRFNPNILLYQVDHAFVKKFDEYLNQWGYAGNTISKHHKNVRKYVFKAIRMGKIPIQNNLDYPYRDFQTPQKRRKDIVYLSLAELEKLSNFDFHFSKALEHATDLFLVGAFTAMGYSDFTELKASNIIKDEKTKMIKITRWKTLQNIVIPLHPIVERIMKKYQWRLPKMSNPQLNRYIKEACNWCGINEDVEIVIENGGIKERVVYKKYELVTAHTARRSAATNMYLMGIPAISIMKITGHTTERNFLLYIGISSEENARILSEHPFFTGAH